MKNFLFAILFIATTQVLFSQISKKEQIEELTRNAKEIKMNDSGRDGARPVSTPSFIVFRDDYSISHEKALEYSKSFCASDNVDFRLKNSHTTKDGKTLYRYEQTIDGYPVEFSAWHVHVKSNRVTTLNGDIINVKDYEPVFSISESEALQAALNYIGAEFYMWQDENEEQTLKEFYNDEDATYYPTGKKVIFASPRPSPEVQSSEVQSSKFKEERETLNFKPETLNSAYKFNIFSKSPYDRKMVYVDAQTGEILLDLPLIKYSDVVGTAHTQYCGIRQIDTYYTGSQYILQNNTRGDGIRTLNCQNGTNYYAAVNFFDDDNIWNNVNPQLDEYATDAHFATMSTYDYFYNVHGRNSIDNYGYELYSFVHFNLIQYGFPDNVNAFWNGSWMTYGDGAINQGITPLTTLDICGHEITHGLTEFTADLVYSYEPGALNEAFSDIFGTCIEFYVNPESANWTIGEQIGATFRSMQNPKEYGCPDTYGGQYWYSWGDVHTNSGVLNRWFYLLCEGGSGVNDHGHSYQVEPIGMQKAEKIAFNLLTEYLTPYSQYYDAYEYAIIASSELYGGCSNETKSVGDAFYAVGVITTPYNSGVSADFIASTTTGCQVPTQISFSNKSKNGISYLWNFGDGSTSTLFNPTHTYTKSGIYTVTLNVDGGICGSGAETKENYITIDETMLCEIIMPINGQMSVDACYGIIYDNGGPDGYYYNESNSILTIHASCAEYIILDIEEFITESWCDYLSFYDGNSTNAPLINGTSYSGTSIPSTISSTGEYITILFVTDYSVTYPGYKIYFHCVSKILPAPELKENYRACNDLIFEVELEMEGTAYWYESPDDNEPVYIGNVWYHHPIEKTKTYFIREELFGYCASDFTEIHLVPRFCSSIISQNQFDNIVITPNPTKGELRITNYELGIRNIEIFDVMGRVQNFEVQSSGVQSSKFKVQSSEPETLNLKPETLNFEPETIIDISNLSNGIYFIKITTDKEIITKKIVKY